MDPPAASTILKRAKVREDFPAPVRPTIPTYSSNKKPNKYFFLHDFKISIFLEQSLKKVVD